MKKHGPQITSATMAEYHRRRAGNLEALARRLRDLLAMCASRNLSDVDLAKVRAGVAEADETLGAR